MSIRAAQQEFMAHILEEERPLPEGWDSRMAQGLAVYRNGYRARLVDALRDTYAKTAQFMGEDSFRRAAAHYLIASPPDCWSLDLVGDSFPETLAALFAGNPELAEIALLEWHMLEAVSARDAQALTPEGFADTTRDFVEADWAAMKVDFVPALRLFPTQTNCGEIWRALSQDSEPPAGLLRDKAHMCLVWREEFRPVFRIGDVVEGQLVASLSAGVCYGDACRSLFDQIGEVAAIQRGGALLGQWLGDAMIASVTC